MNGRNVSLVELLLDRLLLFLVHGAKFVGVDLFVVFLELEFELLEKHPESEIVNFIALVFFDNFTSRLEAILLRQLEVEVSFHVVNGDLAGGASSISSQGRLGVGQGLLQGEHMAEYHERLLDSVLNHQVIHQPEREVALDIRILALGEVLVGIKQQELPVSLLQLDVVDVLGFVSLCRRGFGVAAAPLLPKREDSRVDYRKILQVVISVLINVSGAYFEEWAAHGSQDVAENVAFILVVSADLDLLNQSTSIGRALWIFEQVLGVLVPQPRVLVEVVEVYLRDLEEEVPVLIH